MDGDRRVCFLTTLTVSKGYIVLKEECHCFGVSTEQEWSEENRSGSAMSRADAKRDSFAIT